MKERLRYIVTIMLMLLLGGGIVYLYLSSGNESLTSTTGNCYTKCENKVTITETGISDAVDKIYDAVVIVENYKNNKISSTGTGFIYKKDNSFGYIITNYHVAGNSEKVVLVMSDDKEVTGTYVGGDQYMDISIIKIPVSNVTKIAEIGDSSKSKLGDTVFTIGTPVDYEYRGTVTRGILSGKERLVEVSISGYQSDWVMKVLQTDAAINPGNSGGPLVNSNGEVIGVNSLKLVNANIEGMGFAIPIEDVMTHITTLESGKSIDRPLLGVTMINVSDTYTLYRHNISVSGGITKGVVVAAVESDSPAYNRLEKGDVITKLDSDETKTVAYLKYALYKHSIGDEVKVTYIRDGKTSTVNVKLGKSS